jgi:hypothetical protein
MNAAARPWIGIVFKCLCVVALIFAFVFFMRMQEEQSKYDKLRTQGVVSRALVAEKSQDEIERQSSGIGRRSSGSTTSTDIFVLMVRHVPKSTVRYSDFPTKVKEADLPAAPPVSGDPMKDSENMGIIWVPREVYERTGVGDMLTVANTPWDSDSPVLVSEIEAFDASIYYPRMAIALLLAVVLGLIGWRIGRKARALPNASLGGSLQ